MGLAQADPSQLRQAARRRLGLAVAAGETARRKPPVVSDPLSLPRDRVEHRNSFLEQRVEETPEPFLNPLRLMTSRARRVAREKKQLDKLDRVRERDRRRST